MKKTITIIAAAILLSGCAAESIRSRVKAECDMYGWDTPQCEYAQVSGLREQADTAAKGRQMMRTGSRLYLQRPYW